MKSQARLDVSHLPTSAFDSRATLWWGNLLLLFIETTMFAIIIATYFYIRLNYEQWPPPRVDELPTILDPVPDLTVSTINLLVLLVSCFPMYLLDRAARRKDLSAVKMFLVIDFVLCLVTIALRIYEFPGIRFKWDDNAYASVVWTALGTHMLHLIVASLETFILMVWVFFRGLDDNRALDITITAIYWFWVVGIWVPIYAIIYWGPRIF